MEAHYFEHPCSSAGWLWLCSCSTLQLSCPLPCYVTPVGVLQAAAHTATDDFTAAALVEYGAVSKVTEAHGALVGLVRRGILTADRLPGPTVLSYLKTVSNSTQVRLAHF